MASNYKSISQFNEEQLGKDRASRMSQVAMYADTAHFLYELLQNADDAGASEIHFTVSEKQLVVEHNGTPFTQDNVRAISYFGKGKTDITKIGHFGLGFKSVFAYTASPLVHSSEESFEITQLYSVATAEYPNDLKKERTRFVFPFDHLAKCPDYIERRKWKPAKVAHEEIAAKLANLGAETLLFTKVLTEIHWKTESAEGHYLRDATPIEGGHEVYIITDEGDGRCYLVFDRVISWPDEDGNIKKHHPVQIAFGLSSPLKRNGAVVKIVNARLFVFFPTFKESHVGFIIQGPYRTTPARDNIPEDDDFNCYLVEETAALLKDGINFLKRLGLLNLDALAALPINYERFKEGSFFYPLYSEVRDALSKLPLLPTACGGFISGAQAKLARGKDLVELFSPEQLSALFDKEGLKWLDASLTDSGATADLHTYLVGRQKQQVWEVVPLFEGMQINADTLVPKLTADFLSKQPMDWLIRFIRYAMGGAQRLKEVPFIRLESGTHVSLLSGTNAQPPAWFSPKDTAGLDLTMFPLVHADLATNEPIKKFLEKEGIHEIDAAAIVGQCILPLYKNAHRPFDEFSYRDHLRKIRKAYAEANDTSKNILTENLNGIAWLACVHASGNTPDEIVWKKPEAHDLFVKAPDHEAWFQGLGDVNAYFLHPSVNEELKLESIIASLAKPCKHLWRGDKIARRFDPPNPSDTTTISWAQNNYQEAQDGFHPNADIYGLKVALMNSSLARAQVLWRILIERPHLLRGFVLRAIGVGGLSHAPRSP